MLTAEAVKSTLAPVSAEEREYLRNLAKKYREYSELPVMAERRKRWYAHNALRPGTPMIVMETNSFAADFLPPLRCEHPEAARIERKLLEPILTHELVDDDKVIEPWIGVEWDIRHKEFNLDIARTTAKDARGQNLGYHDENPIEDLARDMHIVKPSVFSVDRDRTAARVAFTEDILGDILDVRIVNRSVEWYLSLSAKFIRLMGMERYFMALIDTPEKVKELYTFMVADARRFFRWMEDEKLLTINNGNHYAGAGSFGFTDELPKHGGSNGVVKTSDIWVNMNSQETVSVSPDMYGELIYPAYQELAKDFGLVYYGCCEPVHPIWDSHLSHLPNLRKVSISAWCDEAFMGERLRGSKVIYSRKPDPTLIGVGAFDEARFREHMKKTIDSARGCTLEIIFRDIYSLCGERTRPGKAVKILRSMIADRRS